MYIDQPRLPAAENLLFLSVAVTKMGGEKERNKKKERKKPIQCSTEENHIRNIHTPPTRSNSPCLPKPKTVRN